MKDITPEIRQKIFALYLGTDGKIENCKSTPITFENVSTLSHWGQILVKDLESIIDEDALFIASTYGIDASLTEKSKDYAIRQGTYTVDLFMTDEIRLDHVCVDYLRSKGYALPYLNWSVDDLVQAGVFKLKP